MSSSEGVVRQLIEALNRADRTAAEQVLHPQCRMYCNGELQAANANEYWEVFASFHRAMPDLHQRIEELVVGGDTVAERWSNRGTHLGEFDGVPPTGKQVEFVGTTFFRVEDQQIVEEHNCVDLLALLTQVGALQAGQLT